MKRTLPGPFSSLCRQLPPTAVVLALLLVVAVTGAVQARVIPFSIDNPIATDAGGARFVYQLDVDKDGDLDLIAGGNDVHPRGFAWYSNEGGTPVEYERDGITTKRNQLNNVYASAAGNIDRDARDYIDVVGSGVDGDDPKRAELRAFANRNFPESQYNKGWVNTSPFDSQPAVNDELAPYRAVDVADLNGDGIPDVVAVVAEIDGVFWFENITQPPANPEKPWFPKAPAFGLRNYLSEDPDGPGGPGNGICDGPYDVDAVNLDGDTDIDLVVACAEGDQVVWFENDGLGSFTFHELAPGVSVDNPQAIWVDDVNNDTYLDVLSASVDDDGITVFYSDGMAPPVFDPEPVAPVSGAPADLFVRPTGVWTGDLDGDGDLDVVASSESTDAIIWFDGDGGSPRPSFVSGPDYVLTEDPDGDHVVDTVQFNAIPEPEGVPQRDETVDQVVEGAREGRVDGIRDILVTDMNGDQKVDLLTASYGNDKLTVHWNLRCGPVFPIQPTVGVQDGITSIVTVDLDGDGDADVVAGSAEDGTVSWFENDGEMVPTFYEHVIDSGAPGVNSVFAADIDGDGNLDLLSAAPFNHTVAWYENGGGSSPLFTKHVISDQAMGARGVAAADVDNDGDMDVAGALTITNEIALWINQGGSPITFQKQTITNDVRGAWSVGFAYIDDGWEMVVDDEGDFIDILSASMADGKLSWFRNLLGENTVNGSEFLSWEENELTKIDTAYTVYRQETGLEMATAGLEPFGGSSLGGGSWSGGSGLGGDPWIGFLQSEVVAEGAISITATDLNTDGHPDIIFSSAHDDKVGWYENPGDVVNPFLENLVSVDPDGATERTYNEKRLCDPSGWSCETDADCPTGETCVTSIDPGPGACADRAIWPCEVPGQPIPSYGIGDCSGSCILEQVGACQQLPGEVCSYEACDSGTGTCEFSGLACTKDSECIDAQCGILGPCVLPGLCDIYRPDSGLNKTEEPIETVCQSSNCESGRCAHDASVTCTTDEECADDYCNLGPCEGYTQYVESIDLVQEGSAFGAAWVAYADLEGDGDQDIVVAEVLNSRIAWYENSGGPIPRFTRRPVSRDADGARSVAVADINGDERLDIVSGSYRDDQISWYLGADDDQCTLFDVNGDGHIDAAELAWLSRAFGTTGSSTSESWWEGADFSVDHRVDGQDLSILGSEGVWGHTVFSCSFTCPVSNDLD